MNYHHITSLEDYYLIHTTSERDIVLYTASWCGPCKELKAFLHDRYPDISVPVLIIDVDDSELAELITEVQGMPTLEFYEQGKMVERIEGFRKAAVQKMLEQWLQ
jgi:thioredoxin 1